jgi:hypothetical protein
MVDRHMSFRDRAKQVLRMCGHALTSTVHDRLDVLERELRSAKLAETNTALLEASIHVVENLHALAGRTIVETEWSDISAEAALLAFLYSHVAGRVAIHTSVNDAGGDGERTDELLDAGFQVYALEAGRTTGNLAIARKNGGMAHVARASGVSGSSGVTVETLVASATGAIPLDGAEEIGLIALGGDPLPVIRVFGDRRASVITADLETDFEELVREMRSREYFWHIVLYRIREANADPGPEDGVDRNGDHDGDPCLDRNGNRRPNHLGDGGMSYYANHSRALPNSRGSVFFFREYRVFAEAQSWCAATLPRTYFKPRQA